MGFYPDYVPIFEFEFRNALFVPEIFLNFTLIMRFIFHLKWGLHLFLFYITNKWMAQQLARCHTLSGIPL